MDRSDTPAAIAVGRFLPTIGTRDAVCPAHGPFESIGTNMRGREVWSTCRACHEEQLQAQQMEQALRQAQIVAKEREEAIGAACIPLRFRSMSFENYVAATPEQRAALSRVRDYGERFAEMAGQGRGLVMAGKPGTGKTHLAAALAVSLLDTSAWVQYTTCMGLIRMVRETWGKDAERTERQVIKLLGQQVDLLLIDEVGAQYGTESEQHILFEILDKRYAEMRPTVLITNQDKAGFRATVGERVADRLTQTHDWLAFDWPSYRRQARAAA